MPNTHYQNIYERRVSINDLGEAEVRNYKTAAIPRKHSSP